MGKKNHLVRQNLPEAYQQTFEEGINDGNFMCPKRDLNWSLGMWRESETTAVCIELKILAIPMLSLALSCFRAPFFTEECYGVQLEITDKWG